MGWFFAVLMVVIIGVIFFVATGRGGQMAPQIDDRPTPQMPSEGTPLTAEDIGNLKFSVVTRGYSMEQVDAVFDRLAIQLAGEGTVVDISDTESPSENESIDAELDTPEVNLHSETDQRGYSQNAE